VLETKEAGRCASRTSGGHRRTEDLIRQAGGEPCLKNSKRNVAVLAPERRRRRREGGMNSKTKNACSNEELRGLTLRHFPEADDARFIELSGGMFNAVYLIESRHLPQGGAVLKIGPDPETEILTYEKEIMHAEIQAYQLLSSRPIPTPKVLAYDLSRQKAPFDYFFMEKVQGRAWNDAAKGLPGAAKRELMKQLGRCNAAVHGVCGEWFGYVKADERFHFDSWGGAFCARLCEGRRALSLRQLGRRVLRDDGRCPGRRARARISPSVCGNRKDSYASFILPERDNETETCRF